jgi:fructose-bisphosphate aldolase class I
MDGSHPLQRCQEVTERTLHLVFSALVEQRVSFEQMLLKPNMVIAGKACPQQASIPEVAAATLLTLRRAVPPAVPGVVFLSGGQNDVLATEHLNAMNQLGRAPWELSFSYGRALQDAALKAWNGNNVAAGQQALWSRAKWNSLARREVCARLN